MEDDFPIDTSVIQNLWRMEETHFWHKARNKWILRCLRSAGVPTNVSVLEVGCGSGAVTGMLSQNGLRPTGIDTAKILIHKANERYPNINFYLGRLQDLALRLNDQKFDVIGLFDVLEHLNEPELLLEQCKPLLKPGGYIVATVPGISRLYSAVDMFSGHKKRFDVGELEELFKSVGLSTVTERGIFRTTIPFMKLKRQKFAPPSVNFETRRQILINDIKVPNSFVNIVFYLICRLEERLGWRMAKKAKGTSLIAIGKLS